MGWDPSLSFDRGGLFVFVIFAPYMARILSIDYGKKRCGVASTDPLQIIVSALDTVATHLLIDYLEQYFMQNEVEALILGRPTHTNGVETYLMKDILVFVNKIEKKYPSLKIDFQDESYTSVQAKDIIFRSGAKKKKRRDKSLIDKISAVLILQKYLNHI